MVPKALSGRFGIVVDGEGAMEVELAVEDA